MESRDIKSKLIKADTLPGSVVYTGINTGAVSYIELISYNKNRFIQEKISIEDVEELDPDYINWLNVVGVYDTALIEELGSILGLDSLVLEDITTVGSRPKYDKYNEYYFILLSMLHSDDSEKLFGTEQLSIIKKGNMIITFQETEGDIFGFIRKRIERNEGRIHNSGSSYLLYTLIDSVVDKYFLIMSKIEDKIKDLESEIINSTDKHYSTEIYLARRSLMELRTPIMPIRGIIKNLMQEEELFSDVERTYLDDINDNINQIIDSLSLYRDLTLGLHEIYLANISNKMNRIMTTLTIITVIFIPLTFLSSVYGMNFYNIPELRLSWGYIGFWVVCIVIFLSMFIFFKKKKWFL